MPTPTKENYLKAFYFLNQKNMDISITALSNLLEVSKSTANSMVKKMEVKGWVRYEKYKPLLLTEKGKKIGANIVRKHRLAEMFLTHIMGFGWEEVHDIAEELEHIQSDIFFDRMDEILGFPTTDPHGSPIPDKNGKISKSNYLNLSVVAAGETVKLCALTNSSKELLLFLNKKNIQLNTVFKVVQIENFDKTVAIQLEKEQPIILTYQVCQCLLVETVKS